MEIWQGGGGTVRLEVGRGSGGWGWDVGMGGPSLEDSLPPHPCPLFKKRKMCFGRVTLKSSFLVSLHQKGKAVVWLLGTRFLSFWGGSG